MAILHAGQRLGSYAVEDLLGTGGMAEVYRATHTTLERPVAIKVINPSFNADPTFLLRFLREAKAVARLSHPNIVTVYDFGEQGELAYLVMEIATGGTLKERARGFRTLAEAIEELAPIADALEYAHRSGIVHRDLKPINLLITEQERLLLADFGLARVASESLDLGNTDGGMILGTPYYMAPEQALGEDVDPRADIYAFGILTYEILTGRVPYDGNSALAVMQQHLKSPPPSIRAVIPRAPEALEQAIVRATAKRREDRFDSAGQFIGELRRAAQEAPDLPVAAALPPTQPRPPATVPASETIAETVAVLPSPVVEDVEPGFTPRPARCGRQRLNRLHLLRRPRCPPKRPMNSTARGSCRYPHAHQSRRLSLCLPPWYRYPMRRCASCWCSGRPYSAANGWRGAPRASRRRSGWGAASASSWCWSSTRSASGCGRRGARPRAASSPPA